VIWEKPAPGLDPAVEARFPKRSCSTDDCYWSVAKITDGFLARLLEVYFLIPH